jgi:hypothetical protein
MLVFNLFFLNYYFLEFDEFIFSFQDTYNKWLKERYEDNPSTHLDIDLNLWLEVGSSSGLDRNQMYELSNIMVENFQTTYSASTVGCSQSISSIQNQEFVVMLARQVIGQFILMINMNDSLLIMNNSVDW